MPGAIDSHAHLQHDRFDGDRDAVIERAVAAGIERICVPGWDIASSEAALELADRHPLLIQPAVGVHPHHAATMDEASWARLESLARDPRVAAIGEIGLDYHRNLSPAAQREAFERQLALAATLELPVLVHDREAHEEVTGSLLALGGPPAARGMLHAFSGDAAMAQRLVTAGFVISFAFPLAYRRNHGPREAAVSLPDGSFVVETDAPYLGPDARARNEPTTALRVLGELARLRDAALADVAAAARATYRRVLGN